MHISDAFSQMVCFLLAIQLVFLLVVHISGVFSQIVCFLLAVQLVFLLIVHISDVFSQIASSLLGGGCRPPQPPRYGQQLKFDGLAPQRFNCFGGCRWFWGGCSWME